MSKKEKAAKRRRQWLRLILKLLTALLIAVIEILKNK